MEDELVPFEIEGPVGRLTGWSTKKEQITTQSTVLFIHPINTQGLIWKRVVKEFLKDRYCILPDLRGHGSSTSNGPFGLDEWVDDLLTVMDCMKADSAHVVGGSLGGPLACALAARAPDRVLSIGAFGSSLNFEGVELGSVIDTLHELGVKGMFRKVFPEITFGPQCDPAIIEEAIELANPNDVETVSAIWEATIAVDATEAARKVRCPSLVVTGQYDITCPLNLAIEMARVLATNLVLIPGIGHMPMLELPDTVISLLRTHFARVDLLHGD